MKIPTLVGIAIIISLIGSIFYWFFIREKTPIAVNGINIEVSDLEAVNITDTTTTIIWQTNAPSVGVVNYGPSDNLGWSAIDNRDLQESKEKLTHFVTLKNLKPNTMYFYKISNSGNSSKETRSFITANIAPQEELDFSFIKPLKGTILNTALNPIDEALIFVEIEGAQRLATFSSTAGNFVMPLKLVLSQDLKNIFNIPDKTPATLTVKKGRIQSKVKILISDTSVNLPPITMGAALDLSGYEAPEIGTINIVTRTQRNLDYNNDKKVNSLDLAIIRGKAGNSVSITADERALYDLNSDGLVDQKDVNQFSISVLGGGN